MKRGPKSVGRDFNPGVPVGTYPKLLKEMPPSKRHALAINSGRKKTPYAHVKVLENQQREYHHTKGYRKVSNKRR